MYSHDKYMVLNTRDFGLPQARSRVYIIGMKQERRTFKWIGLQPAPSLETFLDAPIPGAKPEFPTSRSELKQLLARMNVLKNDNMSMRTKPMLLLIWGMDLRQAM